MSAAPATSRSWAVTVRALAKPPVLRMLFLGFSAGLPFLLFFGTLSIWLTEAGIERSTVTTLSWAGLAFSFKFIWAPLVDRLRLPFLAALLGQRRSWMLVSQICLCGAMVLTGLSDPLASLGITALGAVCIAFSSATQDIVIDAYRIEAAEAELQSMMAASYQAGYRIGLLVSGAGALHMVDWLAPGGVYLAEAWTWTYCAMAGLMGVGILTTLVIPEPPQNAEREAARGKDSSLYDHLRLLTLVAFGAAAFFAAFIWPEAFWKQASGSLSSLGPVGGALIEMLRLATSALAAFAAMGVLLALRLASFSHVQSTYLEPIFDFFRRYGKVALLILLLIGTYRMADIVMGAIANVFYTEMTFTKTQIADYTKIWGMAATIIGGFTGGVIALRWGIMRAMFLGALLVSVTNLLFALLTHHPGDTFYLTIAITGDNFAGGLASAAFVAYLSALTSVRFTAMQYALFSSLMTLFPKILAGYSGRVVDAVGYEHFFWVCAGIGVPVLFIVLLTARYAPPKPAD